MHKPTARDLRQHEWSKYLLRLAGSSMAEISLELGLKQNTVSTVSKGYGRSRRIQSAIAAKLGKAPEKIWPDRYALKGGAK